MKKGIAAVFIIYILGFVGCRHDPQLANAPEVSFKSDVQPILSSNCSESGCHGTIDYRRFSLSTYDDVINSGTITPGDARNSKLYLAILGSGGQNLMPPSSQPSLLDNQITLIYLWIEQGAKNN